jgi:histidinol-phosphate aminotransferase
MFDLDKLVRKNVRTLVPYSSARDDYSGREGIFLDANENPYGSLNRYPDPYQKELKHAVSNFREVAEENIFLGNGSDEIIDLCYRIFCNPGKDRVLVFPPTYGMYEVSAAVNDAGLIRIPLRSGFQIDLGKTMPVLETPGLKLVFICSPNNPTGNSMDPGDVEKIIAAFPGIVVIDEAYIDFSSFPSFKKLISAYPNLVVMQTFSKALGMASARIGMAFTNSTIVSLFNRMKPPYNISTINQRAVLDRLRRLPVLRNQLELIKSERIRLAQDLGKLSIIEEVFPSDANFLLVRATDPDAVWSALLKERIIVRNRSKIVPGTLRITVGTRTENNKLMNALRRIPI